MNGTTTRELVVVSGYYGFDNLGDEAILEELSNELKQVMPGDKVVVLSANPEKTARLFGVKSHDRLDLLELANLFKRTRLFISGGGGLFQNTRSVGSVLYYGMQIMLAHALGAKVMVYAQGIGPLRGGLAHFITKRAFASADTIAVRDSGSKDMLDSWGIASQQTADPVWCLQAKPLPEPIEKQLNEIRSSKLVALSLRTSHNFGDQHLQSLVKAMAKAVPDSAHVVLLPLQADQDRLLLEKFQQAWQLEGRKSTMIDTSSLQYPAQWISLFSRCHMVVAMRLHALIMALKAGVGVVGIAYDPKVSHLLTEFEQPALILANEPSQATWEQTLTSAFTEPDRLARKAMKKAEGAKKLACQNFNLLARILGSAET